MKSIVSELYMYQQIKADMISRVQLKKSPQFDDSVFVAPSADIIGDVTLGSDSSVWFNSTIRGDVNLIRIGDRTNVQDNTSIHV